MPIYFKNGYKYQLVENYTVEIRIRPSNDISFDYITLNTSGILCLKKGFSWDGSSGSIDYKNYRASAIHDALYKLFRNDKLNRGKYRVVADEIFREMLLEDGCGKIRAWYHYKAVRMFGGKAASKKNIKKIIKAPW